MLQLHGDHQHGHSHMHEEDKAELANFIWRQETVELNTVGIDIGSSTSHLLFATVRLQRRSQGLSSRFVVTHREVVWRSPIMLTPFLSDGNIDADKLAAFIRTSYESAGIARSDIDSGAVILTGEAIKRHNARAIDELFAEEAGKFVCATAGHKLECTLAAHGSGAAKLSKDRNECVLHVDIGGGTTKLSMINKGEVLGVCAFAVGGRLLAQDDEGAWTRVDDSVRLVADELGIATDPESMANEENRQKIVTRLAEVAVDFISGKSLDRLGMSLQLTEALPRAAQPTALTFSGGVSEYILGRETKEYGDIAKMLSTELCKMLPETLNLPMLDPGHGIRATVIGASQFTVQVSGKTIFLAGDSVLPVHNVPVVSVDLELKGEIDSTSVAETIRAGMKKMDLNHDNQMALAFTWKGDPEYSRLAAVSEGILRAAAPGGKRGAPLLLMIDGDVARTLGHLLKHEFGLESSLVSVDGVKLQELDFVDVGEFLDPPGVVPVVIKSLLFS